MIFKFLKYLRPTWYLNLRPARDYSYFPAEDSLRRHGITIEPDASFKSKEAIKRDFAWRAFQKGFIAPKEEQGIDVWEKVTLPVEDEYRFLRKNFHAAWVLYVYVFRMLSLKNPFKETSAFLKTKNVKRVSYAEDCFSYPSYDKFESALIKENPLVSVV